MRSFGAMFLILLVGGGDAAFGCAPAPHAGDMVAVVEEAAVIVWDPSTKTEHFIRRATFRGKGQDFGFLVPTPSAPALAEVADRIFDQLEARTRPETVHVRRRTIDWTPVLLMMWTLGLRKDVATIGQAVEVLSTHKIAGYEASVLEASDAGALRQWLNEHGYATTDDLTEWLDVYVRRKWKITAFKIDPAQAELPARTSAVKMSFVTDRPFFPYREPASQRRISSEGLTGRGLRIWFLGPERVGATIGESTSWPAELRRSDNLADPLRGEIMQSAGLVLAVSLRLTAFDDRSSIRPGLDDLFFAPSSDQSLFTPPPRIIETVDTTHVPLDLIAAGLVVLAFIWKRSRTSPPHRPPRR